MWKVQGIETGYWKPASRGWSFAQRGPDGVEGKGRWEAYEEMLHVIEPQWPEALRRYPQ